MFRVLISRLALFALLLSRTFAQQNTALGDVDGDGVATVRDIALIAGYFNGTGTLSGIQQQLADVNRDGAVNEADMNELVKEILGTRTPEKLPLSTIRSTSPSSGEVNVAVTRETIVHFTVPLALTATLDTTKFRAEFGGKKILSRVDISSDRKKATLFYLEPLPSNARIRGTLDTTGLTDLLNRPVDGDGDGVGGGVYNFSFDTLSITPVAATAISGRVIASERGTGGVETPLAGVTVTVDGAEETLRAVTNAQGNFTLTPCPAGTFFVKVDGRTSPRSSWPGGNYYPLVGKKWHALAGRTDNLSGDVSDTQRGTVYLPLVINTTLETVSATADTKVDFPAAVLAANPGLAGTELMVPANSLFADDGTRGGKVGIAPVAPDRLPSPLPPGLNLPLVITIQTDGGTNFDRPVPVSFPNIPNPLTGKALLPGAKSALWSFDHDTGEWEIAGSMTVTEDGKFVKSDPGVGVKQPGWHGQSPGCAGNVPPPMSKGPDGPEEKDPECELDNWDYWNLGSQALDAAWTCAKAFGPAKLKALRGIECAAGALKAFRTIQKQFTSLSSLIEKISDSNPPSENLQFLDSGIALCDIILASCEKIEIQKKCAEVNNPTKTVTDVIRCASALLGLLDAFCNLDGGDCVPKWIKNEICPYIAIANAWVKTLTISLEKYENWIGQLFRLDLCIGLTGTKSFLVDLRELEKKRLASEGEIKKSDATRIKLEKNEADDLKKFTQILSDLKIKKTELSDYIDLAAGVDDELFNNPELINYSENFTMKFSEQWSEQLKKDGIKEKPGKFYYLIELEDGVEIRGGFTGESGRRIILQPEVIYTLKMYDPVFGKYGSVSGFTPLPGASKDLLSLKFEEIAGWTDSDGDSVPDAAEEVVGTFADSSDTDLDGISDGEELREGTDPLNGASVGAGLAASIPTVESALNINSANNLAAIAMGSAGVSVFNVFSGLNPTRILDVDTPGNAVAVACAGDFVCVADEAAGLAVIDAGDPTNIRLARQIPLGSVVSAVTSDGVTAYAGTGRGEVVAVDLATGLILGRVMTGGGTPEDMQIAGDMLYVLDAGSLRIFRLINGLPVAAGSLAVELMRGNMNLRFRLFSDGKIAYCTHSRGYNIVNVENPAAPQLVQNYQDGQFGWKQVTANGSGLGIVAASPNSTPDGPHDINLYNVGADGRGTNFLTTIQTPGLARAVSLYNGFAYVADSEAGLQVINYLPFDNKKVPPTITLASNFNLAGGLAEEGKRMRLTASVTDDVQVRNVEFYVNGALRATDGNYPFEFAFLTPAMAPSAGTFKVRAKATDTGGNMAWTEEFTLTLTPDATPPVVVESSPAANRLVGAIGEVWVKFNEPMAEATMAAGLSVSLNGAVIPATASYREATNTAFLRFAQPLSPGAYQLSAAASVTDAAGNGLAAPLTVNFRVFSLTDDDADGMADDWESLLGLDRTKVDSNNNGVRDGDEDFDGDGLANGLEILAGMDPAKADTDGNGIPDGLEDSDLDGLTDGREIVLGTDRFKPDTDDDTWSDEAEVSAGSDPLNPRSRPYPFMMQSPPVTALSIGKPGSGMLSTVTASPPVTALSIGKPGSGMLSTVTASPPVTALSFGASPAGAGGSLLLAQPPVEVLSFGAGPDGKSGLLQLAQPPVSVQRAN